MKTRKVGKIVSLLVAIVLVATIMIPAAGVLAQPSGSSGSTAADYKGEWTEVSSFTELNDAIKAANNAPEGSAAKNVHIRLKKDIMCLTPYYNNGDLYVYSKTRLMKRSGQTGYAIEERLQDRWTITSWSSYNKRGHEASWLISQPGIFDTSDVNSPFYGLTADDFVNGFVVTKDMQNAVGMGVLAKDGMETGVTGKTTKGFDEKVGKEYSERMLIIEPKTDVTIDLNSHNISAGGTDVFISEPKAQMSVFIVRGTLTVADLNKTVKENGNLKVGTITGGTGNVYYDETMQNKSYSEIYRAAMFDKNWNVLSIPDAQSHAVFGVSWAFSDGNWRIYFLSHSEYVGKNSVKESRGGGVYVENGGTLNLEGGKITGNCAYMNAGKTVFAADVDTVTKGGGVYVEAGGVFNMSGGEVSQNATRSYFKDWTIGNDLAHNIYSEGGGVYLEGSQEETVNGATVTVSGAVFNMTGGKIAENAAYAEGGKTESSKSRRTHSYGAGIYVDTGAVCNIKGADSDSASTDIEMMKSFPQVVNNSCGGQVMKGSYGNGLIEVKGGGIYNDGTVNIKNALIASNDFSEARQSDAKTAVHIMRDEYLPEGQRTITYSDGKTATLPGTGTDLALYVLDYWEDISNETYGGGQKGIMQRPKTYITRLDDRFTDNLQLATEEVPHATSGIFGSVVGYDELPITSDGAGVCVGENGKLVVGERTWITDNYDFLTNGHMAFSAVRNYKRFWAQNREVVDDRVYRTNDYDEKGANYTDPAGGWVYYGAENENVNDGYAYSDTSDDVYLPDGAVIYKGGSLFESKIGVNYWNMVNADGSAVEAERGLGQAGSQAGNRVIVATGKNLDASFWGDSAAQPTARDIQFFYADDNNKNWEKENYQLPSKKRWDNAGQKAFPVDPHLGWDNRVRVAAVATTDSAINKDASPFEGYVNFDVAYPRGYWKYGWADKLDKTWDEESYRISDSHWTPSTKVKDPDAENKTDAEVSRLTEFANSTVNFPQRSYQLTAEMKKMNKSYLQAKYIDYKVVYDTTTFGTEADPVLRFGKTDRDTRNMYVTVNFDEANKHYYGLSNQTSFTLNNSVSTGNFTTSVSPFVKDLDQNLTNSTFTFYGANKPKGTIDIAKVVPDYSAYGKYAQLTYFLNLSNKDRMATQTSISKDSGGKELTDLYFKGWQFYTSYEYGPEVVTLDNKVKRNTVSLDGGSTLDYRGYFAADLSKIFNSNVNAQPCPSMTALWYSKEELAEARLNISNVKYQIVKRDDGTDLLRAVAIAGSKYEKFAAVGFVISTSNATPTIEGGYDYVTNDTTYERLGVKVNGEQKCYDVDQILGGKYYDEDNGGYHSRIPVEKYNWTFADGTVGGNSTFAANVSTGNYKKGYKDAGLFYTNIIITDANRGTVYFVTPYAKLDDGTYYYGESRAICYADYIN